MAISFPVPEAGPRPPFPVLSTRQECFCRHFVAGGNAAEAARRAGYAERSARQTGHALRPRPARSLDRGRSGLAGGGGGQDRGAAPRHRHLGIRPGATRPGRGP